MFYNLVRNDTNILLSAVSEGTTSEDGSLEIANNKTYSFDLTGYTPSFTDTEKSMVSEEGDLLFFAEKNTVYKIIIDYGDGTIETINKPFKLKQSEDSWLNFEHTFKFTDEYFAPSANKSSIIIKIYNFIQEKPETIEKKYDINGGENVEIELVAANITNEKNVAYVFKTKNNQYILGKYDKINS